MMQTLRENLRTHKTFTVEIFYHQVSIKSYVTDRHNIWFYGEIIIIIVLIPTPDFPRFYYRNFCTEMLRCKTHDIVRIKARCYTYSKFSHKLEMHAVKSVTSWRSNKGWQCQLFI